MTPTIKEAPMEMVMTIQEIDEAPKKIKALNRPPETKVSLIIEEEVTTDNKPKKGTAAAVQEYLKNHKPLLNGMSEEVNALGKEFRENFTF